MNDLQALVLAYLAGILTLGYLVIGTFFLKFWHRTRERIFAWFAGSFALLAVQRMFLSVGNDWGEKEAWIYMLRLAAFVVLIIGIIEQNRAASER